MDKKQRLDIRNWGRVKVDERRDWSGLPGDIVAQIGGLLLADDVLSYTSLRGVCKHWRRSTENPEITERRFCPRNWIFMWGSHEYNKPVLSSKPLCRFLNTTNGKYIQAHIPELRNNTVNACIEGLLFITGRCSDHVTSRLLNPFTGCTLEYPDISQLCSQCNVPEVRMRQQSLSFAHPSSYAILVTGLGVMAYAKPGYKEWRVITQELHGYYWHMYFQGYPYSCSCRGEVVRFQMEEEQNNEAELKIETLMAGPIPDEHTSVYYLVECNAEMLLVLRSRLFDGCFKIFKIVKKEREESGGDKVLLEPIRDIGNHALFIHQWHRSFSLSTDTCSCFLRNTIYFFMAGVASPEVYRNNIRDYNMPPQKCYCYLLKEQLLVRRSFSPFPFTAIRHRARGARTASRRGSC